jgi:mRNA interferase RelE/StbE
MNTIPKEWQGGKMIVKLTEEAEQDLDSLSDDLYDEAYKYLKLFKSEYQKYSQPLANMYGRDLRGCRKTYFANTKYRIVSKPENGVVKIVNIIAVGERKNMEVYKRAFERLNISN